MERLWRWCLRNQRLAALTAAVAFLAVAVTAVSLVSLVVVRRQNVELGKAKTMAEDKRQEAERKQKLAEEAQKRTVAAARAANQQNRSVVDAQREMIEFYAAKLGRVPELQSVRAEALDKATQRIDEAARSMTELLQEVQGDPSDEQNNSRSLANSYQALGNQNLALNRAEEAMKQYLRVDEIVERLGAAAPDDLMARFRKARSKRQLGQIAHQYLGDSARAEKYFDEAIKINEQCLEKDAAGEQFKRDLANSLGYLAMVELALGHLDKARAIYDREVDVRASFSQGLRNSVKAPGSWRAFIRSSRSFRCG